MAKYENVKWGKQKINPINLSQIYEAGSALIMEIENK